jgi:carboxyl-terminal processing protease
VWLPLLLAAMLGLGVLFGLQMRQQTRKSVVLLSDPDNKSQTNHNMGKVEEILRFVDARYLEGVDLSELEDAAIEGLLKKLDPHSSYIPRTRIQGVKESLQGNFEGIGVEFYMLDDTILIVGVVPGGPSDKAGVRIGDRFLRVNDSLVAGVKLKNKDVIERLKGEAGSTVKVQVLHRNEKKSAMVSITRGQIPMKSVETFFMLDEKTGYIKVSRFSGQTFEEFMKALEELTQKKGMKDLVIDLRSNPGGYLNEATDILNQLFEDKRLLVYTEGRSYKRKEYKSNGKAYFKVGKVAVLMNEGSASASEILAGAIQDNDRGLVVGRRSFGKGLVQEQYDLSDSSALRLTVARYYTPSGRLIQRPYEAGKDAEYDGESDNRYYSGELLHRDSIKVSDSTEYKTVGGRLVFGGGGIIPDIFVPIDTITYNSYFLNLNVHISPFTYRFMDANYKQFASYKDANAFAENYQVTEAMLNDFYKYATTKGELSKNDPLWVLSKEQVALRIKAQIGQQLFRDEGFYRCLSKKDKDLKRALEELKRTGK